eukprot:TRINITY_DN4882_c1_g1_i1.p1 TRINITY_DN4882_c1_g1~~TRINITY_DN4882_c1_g1_i1.p1  ORF type:complete len:204 (-),score=28.65 TRINITY_DN4882_c1_g1_i1:329-883(-)
MAASSQSQATVAASTLMLQNLPSRCTRDEVLRAVDKLGFEGLYDFFYLPQRSRTGRSQNYGYAFINFIEPADCRRFHELVNDDSLQVRNKSPHAVIAEIQGLQKLQMHFRGKLVMDLSHAPLFADDTAVAQSEQPMLLDGSVGHEASGGSASTRASTAPYTNASEDSDWVANTPCEPVFYTVSL